MLKRTVSGAVYVLILVGFFFLRNVNILFFDAFIWFLSFMGAFEVSRAVKPYSVKHNTVFAIIFGALFVPVYCVCEYFFVGKGFIFAIDLILLFCIVSAIYCLIKNENLKVYGISVLPVIYPAILLLTMLIINRFGGDKGLIALILIFVISPCSDVFAYLVGMTYGKLKKGNVKKLCPNLSPNKTVAGAVGGLIGGAVGALIIYFIFSASVLAMNIFMPAAVYFILIGLLGSFMTQIGDLFESLIKRRVGIKDMGKIMPGHGGVMDRIDGTVFCSFLMMLAFLFI